MPALSQCDSLQSLAIALHTDAKTYQVPNLTTAIDWGLAITLSTAESERDFSKLGVIKTARRNRLSNQTVNCLMVLALDGPPIEDFNFTLALLKWHNAVKRRLPTFVHSTLAAAKRTKEAKSTQEPKVSSVATKCFAPSKTPPAKRTIESFFGKAKSRPNPGLCNKGQAHFTEYETLLGRELSQATIDGRNGSNACTVICAMFCSGFLKQLHPYAAVFSSPEACRSAMCKAMRDGNQYYDDQGFTGYLSCLDICELDQASVRVSVWEDFFIPPEDLKDVVVKLKGVADENPQSLAAGVLVINPYSFCVAVHLDMLLIFDSHCHGNNGALLALLPCSLGERYLRHFFSQHYPQLRYDGSVRKFAQLSILR